MMPYLGILERLLAETDRALAAVLLDREGETIVGCGYEVSDETQHVIGAYQGIFLNKIARHCARFALGELEEVWVEAMTMRVLTAPIHDGYYLVVVLSQDAAMSVARRSVTRAVRELRKEL
jgi:predicted regulator of Ras-like GTPase activity (Roadblock/LC7/MglB family)